ncbi:helix-turn-helix domain-containing protein [Micromonospora sp. L32]|uniref:helix-turn-helix domain-containing protein n=1 Tax=Micromonospora sp. L32 TaxID=3452214 RepID=UPI003F8BC347
MSTPLADLLRLERLIMTDSPAGLGRAIQIRRAELGLKRKDLAERALLSYPYLSELENGTKMPSAKALRQLAAALELSQAELLARADSSPTAREHRQQPEDLAFGPPVAYASRLDQAERHGGERLASTTEASLEEGQLDRLADVVAATVRAELAAWARTTLPALIRDEVRRVLNHENLETR